MKRNDINFNENQVQADLEQDVPTQTLSNISGYGEALSEVNMYCENTNIPLSNGFRAYVMDNGKSKTLQEKFMSPLIKESANLNNQSRTGMNSDLSEEGRLLAEKTEIINEDMSIIQDKFDDTWDLFSESIISTGDLAPMMAAKPPLQYLETIRNNGRLVIDHKTAEDYTVRRKYERKYAEINGEKGYFPDVVRDNDFMDKFLNHSQPEFTAEVEVGANSNNHVNLLSLANNEIDEVNADDDVLYPEARLVKIEVELEDDDTPTSDTIEVYLEKDKNSLITAHQTSTHTPQFFVQTTVDPDDYDLDEDMDEDDLGEFVVTLAGSIDFDKGDLNFQVNAQFDEDQDGSVSVESFFVESRVSGSRINKVSTVGVETTPMEFTIKERINMALSYDPKSLKDFATIENTDGLMKLTSVILDLSEHIKDHKVFKALEEDKKLLKETTETLERIDTGANSLNDYFEKDFYVHPLAGDNYRPSSHIGWREEVLPDVVDDISIEMMKRFNAKSGIKNVIYGDPRATKLFPKMKAIVSKDKEYAGVTVDYDVFSLEIKGTSYRIVSTERAKSLDQLRMIPRSNDKEQETWTFYQHFSHLYKDSSIRDVNAVHLPSIAYIDTFDVFGIHRIMGNIDIETDHKELEDISGETYVQFEEDEYDVDGESSNSTTTN